MDNPQDSAASVLAAKQDAPFLFDLGLVVFCHSYRDPIPTRIEKSVGIAVTDRCDTHQERKILSFIGDDSPADTDAYLHHAD